MSKVTGSMQSAYGTQQHWSCEGGQGHEVSTVGFNGPGRGRFKKPGQEPGLDGLKDGKNTCT